MSIAQVIERFQAQGIALTDEDVMTLTLALALDPEILEDLKATKVDATHLRQGAFARYTVAGQA